MSSPVKIREGRQRARIEASSQALLRLSNRGPPRTEFLREASTLLFAASGADALVAWLDDGERTFLWRAEGGGRLSLDFEELRVERDAPLIARALAAVDATLPPRFGSEEGALIADLYQVLGGRLPSVEHVLASSERTRSLILLPFEIDESNSGVLQFESFANDGFEQAELDELAEMARLLGVAIANRRAQAARAERVKELACMYAIAQIGAEVDSAVDDMLQRIVELLPPAWQYPEVATARIVVQGKTYVSRAFDVGPHCLSAGVRVGGATVGQVEVFYVPPSATLKRPPLLESVPFLKEEHHLIDGVARAVAAILERKRAETERMNLQEQVRHSDRLATIGQLAAGVAHELNEPLSNILGFAQLALKSTDVPDQTRADLDAIVSASLYAREIIKKLMFFARQTPARRVRLDFNDVVRDGMTLMSTRCRDAQLNVSSNLGDAPRWVMGDPAQLQQVLVNLVVNAIQAMPEGGTLNIASGEHDGWVTLEVADSGPGVAEAHLHRLFEPFFTTKEVGEGTGLGLAVVHGIVSAHGGRVEVTSQVGRGTRFCVNLPSAGAGANGEHE
ncbi:MAG: ATP-binding protein [Polyangiaceae bacterium]